MKARRTNKPKRRRLDAVVSAVGGEAMSIAAGYGSTAQLQDQVRALLEENAALRKDAERYRWLRPRCELYIKTVKGGPNTLYADDPQEVWDEAIDAAMRE